MKTPEQYEQEVWEILCPEMGSGELTAKFRECQSDALAEGERRGRIAGLREAAAICSRLGLSPDARVALNDEANRLEKEQEKKSPVDKSNAKE